MFCTKDLECTAFLRGAFFAAFFACSGAASADYGNNWDHDLHFACVLVNKPNYNIPSSKEREALNSTYLEPRGGGNDDGPVGRGGDDDSRAAPHGRRHEHLESQFLLNSGKHSTVLSSERGYSFSDSICGEFLPLYSGNLAALPKAKVCSLTTNFILMR